MTFHCSFRPSTRLTQTEAGQKVECFLWLTPSVFVFQWLWEQGGSHTVVPRWDVSTVRCSCSVWHTDTLTHTYRLFHTLGLCFCLALYYFCFLFSTWEKLQLNRPHTGRRYCNACPPRNSQWNQQMLFSFRNSSLRIWITLFAMILKEQLYLYCTMIITITIFGCTPLTGDSQTSSYLLSEVLLLLYCPHMSFGPQRITCTVTLSV